MTMTLGFRVLLLAAAGIMLWFVLHNIRRSKLVIADSLFWFAISAVFLLLALFPEISFWAAARLGIQSPVNLVYLVIIGILVWHQFRATLRISAMNSKIEELAQQIALDNHDREQDAPDSTRKGT
ncbi:MAG: DUF2304 domain-containing protein [Faecalibacterium sp.]|jgi:hypothetical protein|nr:DUF2304 domain-containing protein [Faecalibacterium sp.]